MCSLKRIPKSLLLPLGFFLVVAKRKKRNLPKQFRGGTALCWLPFIKYVLLDHILQSYITLPIIHQVKFDYILAIIISTCRIPWNLDIYKVAAFFGLCPRTPPRPLASEGWPSEVRIWSPIVDFHTFLTDMAALHWGKGIVYAHIKCNKGELTSTTTMNCQGKHHKSRATIVSSLQVVVNKRMLCLEQIRITDIKYHIIWNHLRAVSK